MWSFSSIFVCIIDYFHIVLLDVFSIFSDRFSAVIYNVIYDLM